ncbi:MAG: Sialic acid TRAP transporter permease protein SiaT [Syntrophorhabdaceae bacterium PtaU1.Bin034]|jgi:tripartite ATP-independent transporter DctM subunit|nr:MAG: Sialic acid TRAP transporter permease protein SiaT [Syntrophorhabdaceae bacterium PtaU1.Bin034]
MNEALFGIVALFVLLAFFFTGIEIGFAMAIVGFVGFAHLVSLQAAIDLVGRDLFDVFSSYSYTIFPVFIFMGQLGFSSGIAGRLYDTANKFVGHVPGGLAMATVAGATAFKAICGSATATAATFAAVATPEMDKYDYKRVLSTGIVASVGTLGCLIPPSVFLMILGIITEQSIGKLFLAGLIPGIITALLFIAVIFGWAKVKPDIAPAATRSTWKARARALPESAWIAVIFLLVVGGVMTGFFTPTESGAVGTFCLLLMTVVKRDMTLKRYVNSVKDSLRTASMFLMLLGGSAILGHFIAATNIPQFASDWIVGLPLPRTVIMIIICLVYLVGGSFIDDIAFVVLATPVFYPAVLKLGYDPIWFCIVIGVTVMIGVVVPPVAICVFVVKNLTKTPLSTIYKGVTPFLIAILIVGILLFLFPQLALYLPSVLMPVG